jgi:peptidyl-prolyl isomerase G (cyclophilin G)
MSVVYFDIDIGGKPIGRMIFNLFDNIVPKTALNFKSLCQGDRVGTGNRKLAYESSSFHRVIPGFMCQGGDFTKGDGTGGESIFGGKFADESFRVRHTKRGQLSMANSGPNTNGSQFFITFGSTPHLNDKHVVFGELFDGMEVLNAIERVDTADRDRPARGQEVIIRSCGVLGGNPEADSKSNKKRDLDEINASCNNEQLEVGGSMPDKRHKKEKKDKEDRKKSKKSKKSKNSKSKSKKHSKKSSKKRKYSSSSSSSDSSRSRSNSSSSESSAGDLHEDRHNGTELTGTGTGTGTDKVGAKCDVSETANGSRPAEEAELTNDSNNNNRDAAAPAALGHRGDRERPPVVDADGVVCRGRGNIKYRDQGNRRGGFNNNYNNRDRGRDGGDGGSYNDRGGNNGDRAGGTGRGGRGRYVPKERDYSSSAAAARRSRSRSHSRGRGGERDDSGDDHARGSGRDNRRGLGGGGGRAVPAEMEGLFARGRLAGRLGGMASSAVAAGTAADSAADGSAGAKGAGLKITANHRTGARTVIADSSTKDDSDAGSALRRHSAQGRARGSDEEEEEEETGRGRRGRRRDSTGSAVSRESRSRSRSRSGSM